MILGSGGFERNEQMRVKYQRAPINAEWTAGATANTERSILAAESPAPHWVDGGRLVDPDGAAGGSAVDRPCRNAIHPARSW